MATKADLVRFFKNSAKKSFITCTWRDAGFYADAAVEWLYHSIASGEDIELRGLGTFYTIDKPERKNNLPTSKICPAQRKVKFKPGRALSKALKKPPV